MILLSPCVKSVTHTSSPRMAPDPLHTSFYQTKCDNVALVDRSFGISCTLPTRYSCSPGNYPECIQSTRLEI